MSSCCKTPGYAFFTWLQRREREDVDITWHLEDSQWAETWVCTTAVHLYSWNPTYIRSHVAVLAAKVSWRIISVQLCMHRLLAFYRNSRGLRGLRNLYELRKTSVALRLLCAAFICKLSSRSGRRTASLFNVYVWTAIDSVLRAVLFWSRVNDDGLSVWRGAHLKYILIINAPELHSNV